MNRFSVPLSEYLYSDSLTLPLMFISVTIFRDAPAALARHNFFYRILIQIPIDDDSYSDILHTLICFLIVMDDEDIEAFRFNPASPILNDAS